MSRLRELTSMSRLRELVKAIRDGDEAMVEAAVLRMSRSRRWLAPLALAVGALEMLFEGVKLVFSNWRLTVVQILPAMWIWLAMLDLKAHVLHGRSFHALSGPIVLPLVAFKLAEERNFDEFDVASQLAAERGWMVPAYTLPPNAQHVTIMRALVKQTLGHSRVSTLADDVAHAVATLSAKGGLHEIDRQRVKTGTGY